MLAHGGYRPQDTKGKSGVEMCDGSLEKGKVGLDVCKKKGGVISKLPCYRLKIYMNTNLG